MPDKMNDVAVDAELRGYTNEQASEAEQRAIEFLTKAVRIPGVRVDRDRYLREALDKVKATDDVIDRALASSPAAAASLWESSISSRTKLSPTRQTSPPPCPSRRASPAASRCSARSRRT